MERRGNLFSSVLRINPGPQGPAAFPQAKPSLGFAVHYWRWYFEVFGRTLDGAAHDLRVGRSPSWQGTRLWTWHSKVRILPAQPSVWPGMKAVTVRVISVGGDYCAAPTAVGGRRVSELTHV